MGICDGKVVVITGAGRGLGREHALGFVREGARVVVNDLAGDEDPAQQVVDEIVASGGEAVANHDDVSDWDGAGRLIAQAIDTFGQLDVLVNNAGILRDRMLSNMSVDEWDAVMKVHAALEERKARTGFDAGNPEHIAPLVVFLGSSLARGVTGRVFNVRGGHVSVAETWQAGPGIDEDRHFDPIELADIVPALIEKARPNSDGRGKPRS